jgi:hypothetical protein
VLQLVDGKDMDDSDGLNVKGQDTWKMAVELCGSEKYFRSMPPFCNAMMEDIIKRTDVAETPSSKDTLFQ